MKKSILALAICAMALTGCGEEISTKTALKMELLDEECYRFADGAVGTSWHYQRYSMCIETKKLKALQSFYGAISQ